jgi:hypothetical protein
MSDSMEYLVDWFSFTLPSQMVLYEAFSDGLANAYRSMAEGGFTEALLSLHQGEWEFFSGNGFYHTRIMDSASKLSISWGDINPTIFIECTGVTCQCLRNASLLGATISQFRERATRIDLTADINTDTTPSTFVSARVGVRFLSTSQIVSPTGETQYVGSWKSDRFARVYRYNSPHPRSKNLRVEHVLKGKWAKEAANSISEKGLKSTLISCSLPFGWAHPDWRPDMMVEKISLTKNHDRDGASRLRWLNNSVAPSLKRAIQDGLIDLDEWLTDHDLR